MRRMLSLRPRSRSSTRSRTYAKRWGPTSRWWPTGWASTSASDPLPSRRKRVRGLVLPQGRGVPEAVGRRLRLPLPALDVRDRSQRVAEAASGREVAEASRQPSRANGRASRPRLQARHERHSRGSSLVLALRLLAEGAHVKAWDPVAIEDARSLLAGVELCEDFLEAVTGASTAVVFTEWSDLKALPRPEVRAAMNNPLIVDGRNLLDPETVRQEVFAYEGIGRPSSPSKGGSNRNHPSSPERWLAPSSRCRRADEGTRPRTS